MRGNKIHEVVVSREKVALVDKDGTVLEFRDVMSPEQAQEITDRIRTRLEISWEEVAEAFIGYAWVAKEYKTFAAYCAGEFGPGRLRLPRPERRAAVEFLRRAGASIRDIAAATGCDKNTAHADVRKIEEAWVSEIQTRGAAIYDAARDSLPLIRGRDNKFYERPRPQTDPDKCRDELETIHRRQSALYGDVIALRERIHAWEQRWGVAFDAYQQSQLGCVVDQLIDMAKLLDEIAHEPIGLDAR
jgi:flagellar motility protein MotE (MotC chaperone)